MGQNMEFYSPVLEWNSRFLAKASLPHCPGAAAADGAAAAAVGPLKRICVDFLCPQGERLTFAMEVVCRLNPSCICFLSQLSYHFSEFLTNWNQEVGEFVHLKLGRIKEFVICCHFPVLKG